MSVNILPVLPVTNLEAVSGELLHRRMHGLISRSSLGRNARTSGGTLHLSKITRAGCLDRLSVRHSRAVRLMARPHCLGARYLPRHFSKHPVVVLGGVFLDIGSQAMRIAHDALELLVVVFKLRQQEVLDEVILKLEVGAKLPGMGQLPHLAMTLGFLKRETERITGLPCPIKRRSLSFRSRRLSFVGSSIVSLPAIVDDGADFLAKARLTGKLSHFLEGAHRVGRVSHLADISTTTQACNFRGSSAYSCPSKPQPGVPVSTTSSTPSFRPLIDPAAGCHLSS
ncbi:MAG: hypothetical protein IPN05_00600 [Sulfuritalea sp.]|nr:hypothetical protein [Sulfuritalea sp.]